MFNEQRFILTSCLVNKSDKDLNTISTILSKPLDWAYITGQLINHRLGGYMYFGLQSHQINLIPSELKYTLQMMVRAQEHVFKYKIHEYMKTTDFFEKSNIRYAALKGLVFCIDMYNCAQRRFSDLDIFVLEEDLSRLDDTLREYGYMQAYFDGDGFIECSKKSDRASNTSEDQSILYVKSIGDGYVELDINYMFDEQDNPICSKIYSNGLKIYTKDGYSIKGLPFDTHLMFLCIRFYEHLKENMSNGIMLYKLIDIYNILRFKSHSIEVDKWCAHSINSNIGHKCYYTFKVMQQFYPHDKLIGIMIKALKKNRVCNFYERKNKNDALIPNPKLFYKNTFNWVM